MEYFHENIHISTPLIRLPKWPLYSYILCKNSSVFEADDMKTGFEKFKTNGPEIKTTFIT